MQVEILGVVAIVDGQQMVECIQLPKDRKIAELYASTRNSLDPLANAEVLRFTAHPSVAATRSAESSAALA